ncbi:hypothetical protein Aph02nite_86820 [Actinoplanes philippinensis]|nr:hypothetical protein Aph02nite_86820 [Actinoplanes philippinensis]
MEPKGHMVPGAGKTSGQTGFRQRGGTPAPPHPEPGKQAVSPERGSHAGQNAVRRGPQIGDLRARGENLA